MLTPVKCQNIKYVRRGDSDYSLNRDAFFLILSKYVLNQVVEGRGNEDKFWLLNKKRTMVQTFKNL